MSDTPETASAPTGRDSNGRFTRGNAGGPGNPFARQTAALRQALLDAVTPEDIAAIARALIDRAKEGNVQAAKLVFTYVLGKPAPAADPDRLDVHEWAGYKETVNMLPEAPGLLMTAPDLPLSVVRGLRQPLAAELRKRMAEMLKNPEKFRQDDDELDGPPSANGAAGAAAPVLPQSAADFDTWFRELTERTPRPPSANGKKRKAGADRPAAG